MRKYLKLGACTLLGVALAFDATSCGDDDPDYSNVPPPTVAVAHSISGKGLSANVSMDGTSVATQTDGTFVFENVKAGTYTLNTDGSANGSVTSETLKENEEGEITMTLTAPAGAVEADAKIIVTPIYSTEDASQTATKSAGTKAVDGTLLIGTDISTAGTNKITAYLIEIVVRAAGAGVTSATGSYPLNVTLPVGTAMSISGQQAVTTLTSALGRSVSGKQYGTISVVTQVWNHQHTGGGSIQGN